MSKLLQPAGEYHQCCTVLWTHSPKPQEHNFSPGKCLHFNKAQKSLRLLQFPWESRLHMEPVLWFFKSTGKGWELFLWFLENYYWSSSPKIKEIVFTQPYRFGSVYEKERELHNNGEYPSLLTTAISFFKSPITTVNKCQRVLIAWVWLVTLNAMFVCNEKENADMDLSKDDWSLQNSR